MSEDTHEITPFSRAGPDEVMILLPISLAMIWANVVFPRTGRSVEENMVQGFFPLQCRLDGDLQCLYDLILSYILAEPSGPEGYRVFVQELFSLRISERGSPSS